MSLDLIKKLVRLANNNPNDNEANLAARKACKMIAELEFYLEQRVQNTAYSGNYSRPGASPVTPPRTWNDVRRSEEPFWRSKPPTEPGRSADDIFDWFFRVERERMKREEQAYREQQKKPPRPDAYEPIYRPYTDDVHYGTVSDEPIPKNKKIRRKLRCKTCHKTIDTVFIGAEELFECNECQWNAYKKRKRRAKNEPPDF